MENASGSGVESSNLTTDGPDCKSCSVMPSWVGYVEIFYLSLIMAIGIPGNTVIILVQKRNKDRSSTEYLIAAMAVYELVCSSLNAAVKILMNTRLWEYIASNAMCRFHVTLIYISTFTSSYLLAAIAVDRYVKTCKPLSNICTRKASKRICALLAFVGLLTGIAPTFTFELGSHMKCMVSKEHRTFHFYWDFAMVISTVLVFSIFVFSYVNIAISLYIRLHKQSLTRSHKEEKLRGQNEKISLPAIIRKLRNTKVEPKIDSLNTQATTSSGTVPPSTPEVEAAELTNRETNSSSYRVLDEKPNFQDGERNGGGTSRQATLTEESVNRTTLMLFLLTIIYAVTFALTNIFVLTADTIIGQILEKLCKSMLMVNCISNPVLFFFMSSKYRASAKRLIFRRWR